jgi:AraC-like DNA-binding protein
MTSLRIEETQFPELSWLADVQEVSRPVTKSQPILARRRAVFSGPAVPHPERHPYCELTLILRGGMLHFSQKQQVRRRSGDVFLAGPGVPHFSCDHRYPLEWITAYFEPGVLLEMGAHGDAGRILQRVALVDDPSRRYFRPAAALRRRLAHGLSEMSNECNQPTFGSELRLRSLLVEMLVAIVRSELAEGAETRPGPRDGNWVLAEQALHYLQQHYAEVIYARDVAAAAGVSQSGLRGLFRDCVGMPWVQYLQNYRICQAMALLVEPSRTVTDVALAVGYSNLSHFATAFHASVGVSPREYARNFAKVAGTPLGDDD